MTPTFGLARSVFLRKFPVAVTAMTFMILACMVGMLPAQAGQHPHSQTLRGTVDGNGHAQRGYNVSLYAAEAGGHGKGQVLGTARTDGDGKFKIRYRLPHGQQSVLFVIAEHGPVMLAGVIGTGASGSRRRRGQRTHDGCHRDCLCSIRRRTEYSRQYLRHDQRRENGGEYGQSGERGHWRSAFQ